MKRLFPVALSAILAAGCENVNHDYFPLAEGNTWTYRLRGNEEGDGAPAETAVLVVGEMVRQSAYRATYRGNEQVWSKEDGFVNMQDAAGRHYLLRLPPHTGYKWAEQDGSGKTRYYGIEAHEDVATPAGTFRDCVRVCEEDRRRTDRILYWYAPEVGLVRRSRQTSAGEVFRSELISCSVGSSEKPAGPPARPQAGADRTPMPRGDEGKE